MDFDFPNVDGLSKLGLDLDRLAKIEEDLEGNSTSPKLNLEGLDMDIGLNFSKLSTNNLYDGSGSNETFQQDNDLQDFLNDLRGHISGESEVSRVVFYTLMTMYIVVILAGGCANALVVLATLCRKSMRTGHNSFIGTLAMSDFLLCMITLPVNLWEMLFEKWPFGKHTETLCSLMMAAQKFPIFLSSMAIIAIGWDRYRCVITPERGELTMKMAGLWIVSMIFVSGAASTPMFYMAQIKQLVAFQDEVNYQDILICREMWPMNRRIAYKTTSCVVQFIIPLIIIIFLNVSVIKTLRKRPPSQHQDQNNRRKRALKIILIVIIIFLIAWAPLNIFTLATEFYPDFIKSTMGAYHDSIYGLMHLLGATNSIANPILYGYMNENFRHEYRKFFRKMPWYSHSLVLVRSIKRNVLSRSGADNIPLEVNHNHSSLMKSSHPSNVQNSLEIEVSAPKSFPPKRLRKMKTNDQILLTNSRRDVLLALHTDEHLQRTMSLKTHTCTAQTKQRTWMNRTSSLTYDDIDIDSAPARTTNVWVASNSSIGLKNTSVVCIRTSNSKLQVRFFKHQNEKNESQNIPFIDEEPEPQAPPQVVVL